MKLLWTWHNPTFTLPVYLVETATCLILSMYNWWDGVNPQVLLGASHHHWTWETCWENKGYITSPGKCLGYRGLGQLKLISLELGFIQCLDKAEGGNVLLNAKMFFRKDVSLLAVSVSSSQLYLSRAFRLGDRKDSWTGKPLLVSPVWKQTHLREVMNDGHFLANRWPPARSLCVLLPDGVLSGVRGRLWKLTHRAHTHTHNGPDSSGCLIYFYVRVWLLDLVKPSVTFTTGKWWAEVSKVCKE